MTDNQILLCSASWGFTSDWKYLEKSDENSFHWHFSKLGYRFGNHVTIYITNAEVFFPLGCSIHTGMLHFTARWCWCRHPTKQETEPAWEGISGSSVGIGHQATTGLWWDTAVVEFKKMPQGVREQLRPQYANSLKKIELERDWPTLRTHTHTCTHIWTHYTHNTHTQTRDPDWLTQWLSFLLSFLLAGASHSLHSRNIGYLENVLKTLCSTKEFDPFPFSRHLSIYLFR